MKQSKKQTNTKNKNDSQKESSTKTVNPANSSEESTVSLSEGKLVGLFKVQKNYVEQFIQSDKESFDSFLKENSIPKPKVDIDIENRPKYPRDPTSLSDDVLGETYGQFVAWFAFLTYKLSMEEATVIYYQLVENKAKKLLFNYYFNEKKMAASSAKISAENDPEYLAVEEFLSKAKAKKSKVQGIHDHYEQCMKGLSREISRRKPADGSPLSSKGAKTAETIDM